jgi:transposase
MTNNRQRFSPEFRERAVRLVLEHGQEHNSRWSAIRSIAEKMGCSAEALRNWVKRSEIDTGTKPGVTTDQHQRLKELERENLELRRANEILRKASAFFAQAELDRRPR